MSGFPDFVVPSTVETPAVCIDLPRMEANIQRMASGLIAKGVALRPHVKSHKSLQVARRQIEAGAIGLTSATIGEAEVFVNGGFDNVFIAYPLWLTDAKAARLAKMLTRARVAIGVSSLEGAKHLASFFDVLQNLEVLIEVDSGEKRTGIVNPADAVAIADLLSGAGFAVTGVFTHGGHSYASSDAVAGAAQDESRTLVAAVAALSGAGYTVTTLSAGSTPTAGTPLAGITEERPGTFVFGDRQQVALGAHPAPSVALYVAATVVQSSLDQFVLDAGAKVFTKDSPKTVEGFGALPHYPQAIIEKMYDHHAVVTPRGGPVPAVGERVAVIPNHVCPVSNLTNEFVVVDASGTEIDRWPVDAAIRNR